MDIHPLISPCMEAIAKLPGGSVTTTKALVDSVYGEPVHFGLEYYYDDGFEMTREDYSALGQALLMACAYKGIVLDAAEYYRKVIGLPFDASYTIRRLHP